MVADATSGHGLAGGTSPAHHILTDIMLLSVEKVGVLLGLPGLVLGLPGLVLAGLGRVRTHPQDTAVVAGRMRTLLG